MPKPKMPAIACLDVAYGDGIAAVAGVFIESWHAETPSRLIVRRIEGPAAEYEPGAFYKRELPLLTSILSDFEQAIGAIVIDGYVWLDSENLPGLGGHLFASLEESIPVIGVAKTQFRDDTWSIPVYRGTSKRPLFVTAAGVEAKTAAEWVRQMHGEHRLPTILKLADRTARDGLNQAASCL